MRVINFNISFDSMPSLEKDGGVGNLRVFGLLNKARDKQVMLANWITVLQLELAIVEGAIKNKEAKQPVQETLKLVAKRSIPDWVFRKPKAKKKKPYTKQKQVLQYIIENGSITSTLADELFGLKCLTYSVRLMRRDGHIIKTEQKNLKNKLTETVYHYRGKS